MRIGDPQTDRVYDRRIAPAIRRIGLIPRRIDRVMHNERIDQRIIRELDQCHVVLADLTFARPSVYWEAGYAGTRVPVVYTCRTDHFHPRAEDEFGNYRVHFDVQTANIIGWHDANDGTFARALEARLRYVLRPMLRNREHEEQQSRERAQFAALSVDDRRERLAALAIRQARPRGFRAHRVGFTRDDLLLDRPWVRAAQYAARLDRDGDRVAHTAVVFGLANITTVALRSIGGRNVSRWIDDDRARTAIRERRSVVDHVALLSLQPVPQQLIDRVFGDFMSDGQGRISRWSRTVAAEHLDFGLARRTVRIWAARIQSEREGHEILAAILDEIRNQDRRR
jgi:hypothetical protein